jgi:hypothetical protein
LELCAAQPKWRKIIPHAPDFSQSSSPRYVN